MTRILFHVLLIAGVLGCLQTCVGPANASAVEHLSRLCPGREHMARHVDESARKHMVHARVLVAIMYVEARCRMHLVGKRGERCAFQVHGVARNRRTNAELADPATCVDTGARWLSEMQRWCRDDLWCALGAYNSGKRNGSPRYSRRVMALANEER